MNNQFDSLSESSNQEFKDLIYRYLSFYPFFILSLVCCTLITTFYLRYEPSIYESTATIKILDKAMDSDMALPTAMTIFNRSTVNLENEKAVIKSRKLLEGVVNDLKLNIRFYVNGVIRDARLHPSEWLDEINYSFNLKPKSTKKSNYFIIEFLDKGMQIEEHFDPIMDKMPKKYFFEDYNTSNSSLPFDLVIDKNDINKIKNKKHSISIQSIKNTVSSLQEIVNVEEYGKQSDILIISIRSDNKKINETILNTITDHFNNDGIVDRQLVFKRTIDFVNNRFELLNNELSDIEDSKQEFKQENDLSYIEADAENLSLLRTNYNSELFEKNSQMILSESLLKLLKSSSDDLLPINIGIENKYINDLVNDYNRTVISRNKFSSSAGVNNPYLKKLNNEISLLSNNIIKSIESYLDQLDISITSLENKEGEYNSVFSNIPRNEKLLRSINREQNIKESLFLLLLQKKEEAAINYAVTKPSIKIVDSATSSNFPVSPNKIMFYIVSSLVSLFLPLTFLYLKFSLDTKIHTKENIVKILPDFSIVGEIPSIVNIKELEKIVSINSRGILAESLRMVMANIQFSNLNNENNNLILVTSSIKGEGKTIISANIASIMSSKQKRILLVGADLRNPQIHKLLGLDKKTIGLSDYIYKKNIHWKDIIIKDKNLDIILSGTIPPNPTQLLSSKKFESFINDVKLSYDYVVIDSAPCLLVSDTFEISKYVDTTLYILRANYTDYKLTSFINECRKNKKLSNINLVLNGVGISKGYGYKYGYRYGYKYGYNYGYGYGYDDSNS